jgi:hypothetical protein
METAQAIERYIIILLGVFDRPIPSELHLQKELFVLSKAVKKINEYIIYEKHHEGPYSVDLRDVSADPIYHPNAYKKDYQKGFILNPEGRQIFEKIIAANSENPEFIEILAMSKMVRELYDKLSRDELLLLIYSTYSEYTEFSTVSKRILEPRRKEHLAKSLLKKGVITEERYREIMENK